jgi:hypothetical protein
MCSNESILICTSPEPLLKFDAEAQALILDMKSVVVGGRTAPVRARLPE